MYSLFFWTHIISALLLIGVVLLQKKAAGLSSSIGGAESFVADGGVEKTLERATIVLAVIFFGGALGLLFA